jgi:anti-sigma factor RsiW
MTDPPDLPCRQFVELVTDYLEGALSDDELALVEAHLGVCPGCRHVVDQWRATIELVGALDEDEVDRLDPDVRSSLMDAFRTLRPPD